MANKTKWFLFLNKMEFVIIKNMTPNGTINEQSPIWQEFQNITLLDLIRLFNDRNSLNSNQNLQNQMYSYQNEIQQILDIIARHFGYYDRNDMKNQNQYDYGMALSKGVNSINPQIDAMQSQISLLNEYLNNIAKMHGYGNILEMCDPTLYPPVPNIEHDKEALLSIDKAGNVWINGMIENNPTKLGREILRLASTYKDNVVLKSATEYFNS